jgi:broad specificity phosphatase PhoE
VPKRYGAFIMTATLILVRHAAHVHLDRVLSGRMADVPLSEAGHAQAARLAEALADRGVTTVQASPLTRAQETARAIAGGLPVETVDALGEIDFGAWTGRSFADLHGNPEWDRWNRERATARPPGGESMAEAQARLVAHLATAQGTTVMVTHADMIRTAVCYVLGLDLGSYWRFDVSPASQTVLQWEHWGGRLVSLNLPYPSPRA